MKLTKVHSSGIQYHVYNHYLHLISGHSPCPPRRPGKALTYEETTPGTALVVQRLRIRHAMQETWVQPLVGELRSYTLGSNGGQGHNYRSPDDK